MSGHDGEMMFQKYRTQIRFSADNLIPASSFRNKIKAITLCIITAVALCNVFCYAEDTPQKDKAPPPALKKAVLCEKVLNRTKPINEGVVFSSNLGSLVCFTDFDPVYENSVIYHRYYFKDKFVSEKTRKLKPPRWATYSQIDLRQSDKGPWRVEITDADGNILTTIRFSITD
jgi:hypothetical protein